MIPVVHTTSDPAQPVSRASQPQPRPNQAQAAEKNAMLSRCEPASMHSYAVICSNETTALKLNSPPQESIEAEGAILLESKLLQYDAHHQLSARRHLRQNNVVSLRPIRQVIKFSFSTSFGRAMELPSQPTTSSAFKQYREVKKKQASGRTAYRSLELKLPVFIYHTPLRTNYNERNVDRMNADGYFPGFMDLDEEKLKKITDELKEAYKIKDYKVRLYNGHASQSAKQMSLYLKPAFERLNMSAAMFMRFMLEWQAHVGWVPEKVASHEGGTLRRKWTSLIRRLPDIAQEEANLANSICQAFFTKERVSMWYLVRYMYETGEASEQEYVASRQLWSKIRCRVCHV
jgi:hypothetical protein